jgi:hypothetical protein
MLGNVETMRAGVCAPSACVVLQFASHDPEQIREPIEVREDCGLYGFAGLDEAHDPSFRATADSPCDIERRADGQRAWQGPVGKDAFDGLEAVHLGCQRVNHLSGDGHLWLRTRRWCRERRADREEIPLNPLRQLGDLGVLADRPREAERRVQLVDVAVRVDAERCL